VPVSGYTLPVFAVGAAKAALLHLRGGAQTDAVALDLLPGEAEIPVEQVARLDEHTALAVTRSDPGDNLDLTRDTPVWAWVHLTPRTGDALVLEAGEGLGRTAVGDAAIYRYARALFATNLEPLIPASGTLTVRIVLPEGRRLAERTSNAAFGVLEGLALLGTSGIAQPLSAAEQLERFREQLRRCLAGCGEPVLCVGSHGMQVAERLGVAPERIVLAGNWLGALLVEAALGGARSVGLVGYHGKLLKLAGGIFHTSSHVADARLEILAAATVACGLESVQARAVLSASTADAAARMLGEAGAVDVVFPWLARRIAERSRTYVRRYAPECPPVAVVLFDRSGHLLATYEPQRGA